MKPLKYNYIVIFCFICFFSQIKAQDTTNTSASSSIIKNGVGISFSPLFSKSPDISLNNDFSKGGIGWSLGINNILMLSKKRNIFLYTEIGYLNNRLIFKNLVRDAVLLDAQGNISVLTTNYDYFERYNSIYFSTAIGSSILKLSKRTFLIGTIGVRLNYLYQATFFTKENLIQNQISNGFISTYSGASIEQNITVAAIASIGITQQLSNKFSLLITPQFVYELNNVTLKLPVNPVAITERKFLSGSLYLSVLYNF